MIRLNSSYIYQKQLKNRSSKHLKWMTGIGTKPILKCVSREVLQRWVNLEVNGAIKELNRRNAKKDSEN